MSAVLAIDPAHPEPISRQVTRALRHAIVTMRLKPGEMLSEQEIATQFGVSRQPVREAFIKLGDAGLLRILPQRGTQVVKISRAAVEDARFIREAVECAVAREAARRAPRPVLAALGDNLARQRRAARARDLSAFFTLDEEFHRLLAEGAGRPRAWAVVEDVKPQMDRVRFLSMEDATPLRVLVEQHIAVAEAVKAGDADAAEAAMRAHLAEILRSLPQVAERHPELFESGAS
ncbi:MAG TPA: GntR family transcriptional regulator [Microvirga sp.]|nr:GntR family transcriptional regulator [Microvirga sp.]